MDGYRNPPICLPIPQLLHLWRLAYLYRLYLLAAYLQQHQAEISEPAPEAPKPPLGQKSENEGFFKEKPLVTPGCVKENPPSVRQWASSEPIFANGAVSAGFAYLFSNAGQALKKKGFASGQEAAWDRLGKINQTSIVEDREYAGLIYEADGRYFATPAVPGDLCASGAACSSSPFDALSMVPSDATVTGIYHTHGAAPYHSPNMFSNFSPTDVRLISRLYQDYGINNSYLATPQGNMLVDYGHTTHNDAINIGRLPNLGGNTML